MVDLGRIQQRLKNDSQYREAFFRDPIQALAQEGLILPFQMQLKVRQAVARASQRAGAVPGARSQFAEKIELPLSMDVG